MVVAAPSGHVDRANRNVSHGLRLGLAKGGQVVRGGLGRELLRSFFFLDLSIAQTALMFYRGSESIEATGRTIAVFGAGFSRVLLLHQTRSGGSRPGEGGDDLDAIVVESRYTFASQ